jgi:hypothetical protein
MLDSLGDHRLFSDFKQVELRFDFTLVFPRGTGGNYIMGSLCGQCSNNPHINEYLADSIYFAKLDNKTFDPFQDHRLNIDPDQLYDRASDTAYRNQQAWLPATNPRISLLRCLIFGPISWHTSVSPETLLNSSLPWHG